LPSFTPLYRRIMDDIRHQIEAGVLAPGQELPTTDQLAEQYTAGRSTVRIAVGLLLEAGVLRGHQGKAVYVAGESPELAE
jgi:DNA-binding GntR family transcriptional regulator